MNAAARLASPRVTLAGLAALGAGVLAYGSLRHASAAWVVVPLFALAVNLAAAIAFNPVFRRDGPMLAFHLALLAVLALAAAGRLTYLRGQVELAEGEIFTGQLSAMEAGPLHAGALDGVRFVNDGFSIRYAAGLKRAETRNRVRVLGEREPLPQVIGDNEPLRLAGYRFYTSFNKGFSLVFQWYPAGGAAPERGTVNLPAYPAHEAEQALDWKLPGVGPALWTQLQFGDAPLDGAGESWFRKPDAHRVIVRIAQARWELAPGEQVRLDTGTLVYEGLSTWMGYNVFYDWTMPWLIAACAAAVAALAWHLARRFARAPWDA